jgi:predicted nucleotidyltransferase
VVLYGSAARGEDGITSDIDLFVVAKDISEVAGLIRAFKFRKKIQPVIKTAVEALEMEGLERVFWQRLIAALPFGRKKMGLEYDDCLKRGKIKPSFHVRPGVNLLHSQARFIVAS